jgi:undecaprenyl-diphosphatase
MQEAGSNMDEQRLIGLPLAEANQVAGRYLVACLGLLALIFVLALTDETTFRFFNQDGMRPLTKGLMWFLSQPAVNYVPLLALGLWLAIWGGTKGRLVLAGLAILFFLTDFTLSQGVRPLFDRPRPWASLTGVHYLHKSGWMVTDLNFLAQAPRFIGFPSAHASNTMGLAFYLGRFYPALGLVAAQASILIGLSRIYTGMHFPADILAGYVYGALAGLAVAWAIKKAGRRFFDYT